MRLPVYDCRADSFVESEKNMDVEGFEPSTSRMQSVRATTVPNALKCGSISKFIG
jgi:hypothetical protein